MNPLKPAFSILLRILTISLIGVACAHGEPLPHSSKRAPLVFIHGIKGSTLVDKDLSVQWVTPGEALNLSTPDLSLPTKWVNGVQGHDGLVPHAVISDVSLFFGLIGPEIYGPWLDSAKRWGDQFYPFVYDWRRDNLESLDLFSQFIDKVRAENPGAKIKLVGHSMGGTIGLAYLNQHPEYFSSATFAGAPFTGGIGFLRDLQQGTSTGLNKTILSPTVLSTFPSVYSFFALNGRGLVENDGTPIPMDFYSLKQLKEKKVALFANPDTRSSKSSKELDSFLETTLSHCRQFRVLMAAAPKEYPPLLIITSKRWATLDLIIRNGPKSILGWDFETAKTLQGDGQVSAKDAIPKTHQPYRIFYSQREHTFLLNDPQAVEEIEKMP